MTNPKPDLRPGPDSADPVTGPSEFGGGGGLIQSTADRHNLTASEQALLLRREGMTNWWFENE